MMRMFGSFIFITLLAAGLAGQTSIRKIDFANFTYPAFCIGEEPEDITVRNGEFSVEKQEDGYIDRYYFKVYPPEYGDLTGDGVEEAVVRSVCNTGGTGNFSEGYIFRLQAGRAVLLARFPGGDRAYGGLHSAKAEKGLLVVESYDPGELGGACCPEFIVTARYRLRGETLERVGEPHRRALFPTQQVRFARGRTGATLKVTIPGDGGRRFVVGARAGQILSVSTDSGEVTLRLLEDAEITENVEGFSARLPKTGNYTIEAAHGSGSDAAITLNIKIN